MPLPLAILCGILLTVLIFVGAGYLLLLSMLLLPVYYAIRNVWAELPKVGQWKVRWERFFQVIFVELIVFIMFVVAQYEQPASVPLWILAYLLYMLSTSLCISISKDISDENLHIS